MSHAPQTLNAKAASSAFSQPTGSARRLTTALSLRRGSSFVMKNPAPSELDQKKTIPSLQRLVDEDAGNSEDNAGGGANADDHAQPPESEGDAPAPAFNGERYAEGRGRSSSSPLRSPNLHQADNGSSLPRRVNFQVQPATGAAESAAAAPSDQLPSGGGSAPPVVAGDAAPVPPPATQSEIAAAQFKKAAEEKYVKGAGPPAPGSRRNRPEHSAKSADAASAAAGDKSGWVDKMKKNIVGFFEGGDSDASSSEEEHGGAAAAADDVPPSEVDANILPSIIAAIKAAQPPLVRTNSKKTWIGTETHPHSLKGGEFVDWLLDHSKAGGLAVPTRARAVAIGEAMCSRNLMRGSEKGAAGAAFKDGDSLYRCAAAAEALSRIACRLSLAQSRCSLHASRDHAT